MPKFRPLRPRLPKRRPIPMAWHPTLFLFSVLRIIGATRYLAALTATPPGGVPGWKFEWFIYNQATNSWNPHSTQNNVPSSTISNLASGGYRVVITDGQQCGPGLLPRLGMAQTNRFGHQSRALGCEPFTLVGQYNSNNNFTYYNPPPDPFIVNANTQITVCFSATHTYVSDLGFYLVSPGGGTTTLSPNPGQRTRCHLQRRRQHQRLVFYHESGTQL